jgi:hypothetical protein
MMTCFKVLFLYFVTDETMNLSGLPSMAEFELNLKGTQNTKGTFLCKYQWNLQYVKIP